MEGGGLHIPTLYLVSVYASEISTVNWSIFQQRLNPGMFSLKSQKTPKRNKRRWGNTHTDTPPPTPPKKKNTNKITLAPTAYGFLLGYEVAMVHGRVQKASDLSQEWKGEVKVVFLHYWSIRSDELFRILQPCIFSISAEWPLFPTSSVIEWNPQSFWEEIKLLSFLAVQKLIPT